MPTDRRNSFFDKMSIAYELYNCVVNSVKNILTELGFDSEELAVLDQRSSSTSMLSTKLSVSLSGFVKVGTIRLRIRNLQYCGTWPELILEFGSENCKLCECRVIAIHIEPHKCISDEKCEYHIHLCRGFIREENNVVFINKAHTSLELKREEMNTDNACNVVCSILKIYLKKLLEKLDVSNPCNTCRSVI